MRTAWRAFRVRMVLFLRPYGLTWALDRWALLVWRRKQKAPRTPASKDHHVLVVCAHFNHAEWLPGCVDSLIRQSCPNWTLVIADDASTDPVDEVLVRCAALDERVEVIRLAHNRGAYVARNTAIRSSNAPWTHVAFVDPDDVAEPGWLDHVLALAGPDDGWVRPLLQRTDDQLKGVKRLYHGHCQTLFSRGLWDRLGGFLDVRVAGDTQLLFRASRLGVLLDLKERRALKVSQKCRVHAGNASRLKAEERKHWLEDQRRTIGAVNDPEALYVEPAVEEFAGHS